jgi:hypothetical protein
MPSSSKKQHNFMEAVAHSPAFAKKVGVPQSVGQDFNKADKGRKFSKGGDTMASKMDPRVLQMLAAKAGAARSPMAQRPMPSAMAPGMKKGGMAAFEKSGKDVEKKGMKEGSKADMALDKKQMMGMKKGGMSKMAGGGLSAGHKSADGIASKGKTKGTNIAMKKGGKVC